MATFSAVFKPTDATGGNEHVVKQTIGAGASGAEIVLGNNQIFQITAFSATLPAATANINVKFGVGGLGAATNADMGLPLSTTSAGVLPVYFDTGDTYSSIRIFNNSAVSVDVYVSKLSRV